MYNKVSHQPIQGGRHSRHLEVVQQILPASLVT